MAAMITVKCKRCKQPFEARVADRKRGWGKFCSKSCKAIKQTASGGKRYPRHDGVSPMKHKHCDRCSEKAVNGVYTTGNSVMWLCADHMVEESVHPFSSEAHGQW